MGRSRQIQVPIMRRSKAKPTTRSDDELLDAVEAGAATPGTFVTLAWIEFDAGNYNAAGLRAHEALALSNADPAAMAMLARALFELRDFNTALTAALNALAGGSDDGDLHHILATAAARLGATITETDGTTRQPADLIAAARRRAPTLAARYEAVLRGATGRNYDLVTEAALLRAFRLGAQPVEEYYPAVEAVAARDGAWTALLDRAAAALALNEFDMFNVAPGDVAVIARQRPLLAHLRQRSNVDLRIELLLTAARKLLLDQVSAGRLPARPAMDLAETLAWQTHLNEHVFHESADEAGKIAKLEHKLRDSGIIESAELICLATYRDLDAVSGIDRLDRRRLSQAAQSILTLTVDEAADRRRRAGDLAEVTAIDDAVSQEVRSFYETTPYPRWRILRRRHLLPRPYREVMAIAIPHMQPLDDCLDEGLDVLVAGCGTGKALDAPRRYRGARITALDLSTASLTYAWQRHDGLAIRYIHGDILRLRDLGARFDVVECTGVVHHLNNPWAGIAALADVLRPGGTLLLAVYSPGFRHLLAPAMTAAARVANATLGPLKAGIAAARRHVLAHRLDSPAFGTATTLQDFFSTSEFRDLLLHPVERPLSLAELVAGAAQYGLRPIGLMPTNERLRARLAAEPTPADIDDQLATWNALERSQPELFLTMIAVLFRKDD